MGSEMEMVKGDTYFKKKDINKFRWQMIYKGRVVEREPMDYVFVEMSVQERFLDLNLPRRPK